MANTPGTEYQEERAFPQIESVPTFHPTDAEFRDPFKYITSIYEQSSRFGICVIVPPDRWQPKFSVPETMTFSPATQSIARLCSRIVQPEEFLTALTIHNLNHGLPIPKKVTVGEIPIDLDLLHKQSRLRGGKARLQARHNGWASVARALGLRAEDACGVEEVYETYLDHYSRRLQLVDPPTHVDGRSSKTKCLECSAEHHPGSMLWCTGCERPCHPFCTLHPPSEDGERDSEWFCSACIQWSTKSHFPIKESRCLYSCKTFEEVARNRKANYFRKPASEVRICEVERAYWRELESKTGSELEVEYGNDLDTAQHGSGFPSKQDCSKHEYGQAWYFDQLIRRPENLLRGFSDLISGITNPWLYVAQFFSTFCWHNEDCHSLSINYMHAGDSKIWYTVPASNADKFGAVMRRNFPELFEAYPNALFQLCTMISPDVLHKQGVEVYTGIQKPGTFVVTFPKAYHAGFSTGYNCAEAVNFALPEWLPYAQACKEMYRGTHRISPFCVDQVILDEAGSKTRSRHCKPFLEQSLRDLIEHELEHRERVKQLGVQELPLKLLPGRRTLEDGSHTLHHCSICRQDLFVSFITCKRANCRPRKVCLRHVFQQCDCEMSAKQLYCRNSVEDLKALLVQLQEEEEEDDEVVAPEDEEISSGSDLELGLDPSFEFEIMESEIAISQDTVVKPEQGSPREDHRPRGPAGCLRHPACTRPAKHVGMCKTKHHAPQPKPTLQVVGGACSRRAHCVRQNRHFGPCKVRPPGWEPPAPRVKAEKRPVAQCERHTHCERGHKHGGHCRIRPPGYSAPVPQKRPRKQKPPGPALDLTGPFLGQRTWCARKSKLIAVAVCTELIEDSRLNRKLSTSGYAPQKNRRPKATKPIRSPKSHAQSQVLSETDPLCRGVGCGAPAGVDGFCGGCVRAEFKPPQRKRKFGMDDVTPQTQVVPQC